MVNNLESAHPGKKNAIRSAVEAVGRKIYGYDLKVAGDYLASHFGYTHAVLHHPDTQRELDMITDMVDDPTPAFYKNVSMTRLDNGGKLVQFSEPTYKHTKGNKETFYYGMNVTIVFDAAGNTEELVAEDRTHQSRVTWKRNTESKKIKYDATIDSMPDGIIDSQRFASEFLHEVGSAVFTFIDRLGTTKADVSDFRRSTTYTHQRDDVVTRQGRMDRAMFFHTIGKSAPIVIGGGLGFASPLLANAVAFGLILAAPKSETTKRYVAGALAPTILRLAGCTTREIPTGGNFTIVDMAETLPAIEMKPFAPNPQVPMIPETSITAYSDTMMTALTDPMSPRYMGDKLGYIDARVFESFSQRTNLGFITKNILNWLSTGDMSSTTSSAWETITAGPAVDAHGRIIQTISAEGIGNGNIRMLGFFDLNQHRGSNILRQGLVIEFEGKQYMLKIQPYKAAVQETTSLTRIQQIDPEILVANESVFKRVFSTRSKLTITISDVILVATPDGTGSTIAPTLESFMLNGQALNEVQLGQLSRIYRTMLISHLQATTTNPMLGADILKPANIAINADGSLVVIDGFSANIPSFASVQDGKIVITQSDPLKHLFEAKNMLRKLGLTDLQLGQIESDAMAAYGKIVEPGQSASVNLVNNPGEVAQSVATVTNDTSEQIYVPNEVLVPRWVRAFGTGVNILFAAWVAKSTYDFILPFDVSQEAFQEPAYWYARRGLDVNLFMDVVMNAPASEPYTEMLRAHMLNRLKFETIVSNMDAFHGAQDFRTMMQLPVKSALPEQMYARQINMEQASYATPTRDPIHAWITPDGSGNFAFFVKQPIYVEEDKTLYLEPTEIPLEGFAGRNQDSMRNNVLSFDQNLTEKVRLTLEGTETAQGVFTALQDGVNSGVIDFYTVSLDGYLVFGYATNEAVELRYVATMDAYKENQILRAVKLEELLA